MSAHIEWSSHESGMSINAPGVVVDEHGTSNDEWAVVGDGFAIEGSLEDLRDMLASALDEIDKQIAEHSPGGDRIRVIVTRTYGAIVEDSIGVTAPADITDDDDAVDWARANKDALFAAAVARHVAEQNGEPFDADAPVVLDIADVVNEVDAVGIEFDFKLASEEGDNRG